MRISTPIHTCKRILVILTACVLQFASVFVFATDNNVTAGLNACKVIGDRLAPTT